MAKTGQAMETRRIGEGGTGDRYRGRSTQHGAGEIFDTMDQVTLVQRQSPEIAETKTQLH